MNPRLAAKLGVVEGDAVLVESRRGAIEFAVFVSEDIRVDTLFAPFHWVGKRAANVPTIGALEPTTRMPEFKVLRGPSAVGGGGSARCDRQAGRDAKEAARDHRQRDGNVSTARPELALREGAQRYEITVFGEEKGGAYNRILLGRVLAGEAPDAIVTKPTSWYERHGVRLVDGMKVVRVDPRRRSLRDERAGAGHPSRRARPGNGEPAARAAALEG